MGCSDTTTAVETPGTECQRRCYQISTNAEASDKEYQFATGPGVPAETREPGRPAYDTIVDRHLQRKR